MASRRFSSGWSDRLHVWPKWAGRRQGERQECGRTRFCAERGRGNVGWLQLKVLHSAERVWASNVASEFILDASLLLPRRLNRGRRVAFVYVALAWLRESYWSSRRDAGPTQRATTPFEAHLPCRSPIVPRKIVRAVQSSECHSQSNSAAPTCVQPILAVKRRDRPLGR